MKFSCKVCNYETNIKSHFNSHLKTKNHQLECEKTLICGLCTKVFSSKYYIRNHIKTICNESKQVVNNTFDKTTNESEKNLLAEYYKLKYEMTEKIVETEKEHNKYLQNIIDKQSVHTENVTKVADNVTKVAGNATKVAARSLSVLKYLQKNFTNANTIEQHIPKDKFYPYTIGEFIKNLLIAHQQDNGLTSFIEDHILAVYKHEDPSKQALWNTDMNRKSYVTYTKIDNDKPCWKKDPDGVKVHKNVIIPAIQYAAELIESVITPLYDIRVYLDHVDNNYKLTHVKNLTGIPDVMDFTEYNKLPLIKKIEESGKLMMKVDEKIQEIGMAKADLLEQHLKDDVKKRIAPKVYFDVTSFTTKT